MTGLCPAPKIASGGEPGVGSRMLCLAGHSHGLFAPPPADDSLAIDA